MKLPRDLSAEELVRALADLGYEITRQTGSHIRLTTQENGEHHLTIPAHDPIKVGTLNSILRDVANHFDLEREDLLNRLFL
ncbi:YcfA family protein [Tolypothrix sp. NIES-4075]|nr:YcfA family protein [Tolypothrix sp. NIES-4075]